MKLSAKKKKWQSKINNNLMQNIDYARLRDYNIKNLLKYEITSTPFYLTKDDYLCKCQKSELAAEIKKPFKSEYLSDVPMGDKRTITAVDFMAYARKIPVKKAKLKTYGNISQHVEIYQNSYGIHSITWQIVRQE